MIPEKIHNSTTKRSNYVVDETGVGLTMTGQSDRPCADGGCKRVGRGVGSLHVTSVEAETRVGCPGQVRLTNLKREGFTNEREES